MTAEQLDLADALAEVARAHTITGHRHPASSHAAAARVLPRTGTQRRKVLDLITSRGDAGATDDEVAALTGIPANSVRPRRASSSPGRGSSSAQV